MKHYCREEWNSYIEDKYSEDEKYSMENHLADCETCINLYIDLLEERESFNKTVIPLDLTANIMHDIEKKLLKKNNYISNKKKIFIYYTAAACITLFLISSGAFNMMTKSIPLATAEIIHSPSKIEASILKLKFNNTNFNLMNLFKIKL